MFKWHTNLPVCVRLQPGVCVMYLMNDMISGGICNGTIGVVTQIEPQTQHIHVSFLSTGCLRVYRTSVLYLFKFCTVLFFFLKMMLS